MPDFFVLSQFPYFMQSAPYPDTDESDVENRDAFILDTYKNLHNVS
jgi:hypothetical protein